MSDEYENFLNWCKEKWEHDYKMQKLLSKLSNDDKDFLKDQYEARLMADMVAMLNDLADEISSLTMDNDPLDIADYIREKINSLKENTDV